MRTCLSLTWSAVQAGRQEQPGEEKSMRQAGQHGGAPVTVRNLCFGSRQGILQLVDTLLRGVGPRHM